MELLLIIAGGILSTAIVFMVIEWARGDIVSDDEIDAIDPGQPGRNRPD